MTHTEALTIALAALELVNLEFVCGNGSHHAKKDRHEWDEDCPITDRWREAITAIKEALAQPYPEAELKAENAWIKASEKIIAEQDAKLKLALYRAVKTYHEGKPVYVAQEQEPLEYWNAVEGWVKIDEVRDHMDSVGCGTIYKTAGEGRVPLCIAQPQQEHVGRFAKFTDGIWREVTDGSAGVPLYTTPPQQEQNLNCKSVQARLATAWGYTKVQPQQEPLAWRTFDGEGGYEYRSYDMNEQYKQEWEQRNPKHKDWVEPLYTSPPQRTWKGLTDEEALDCWPGLAMYADCVKFWENIEAKLKAKNEL